MLVSCDVVVIASFLNWPRWVYCDAMGCVCLDFWWGREGTDYYRVVSFCRYLNVGMIGFLGMECLYG